MKIYGHEVLISLYLIGTLTKLSQRLSRPASAIVPDALSKRPVSDYRGKKKKLYEWTRFNWRSVSFLLAGCQSVCGCNYNVWVLTDLLLKRASPFLKIH